MRSPTTYIATLLGLGAIALWAVLAALTTFAGAIPPFQLTALTFAIGTLVGIVYAKLTGQSLAALRDVPLAARALGVYGLLLFHVCYFFALQRAPALEASLIIYLWPLLIVIFSGLLPARVGGTPLRWWHYAGAALGFVGAALILLGGEKPITFSGSALGYLLAISAAFIWSSYSVASRLFAAVPSVAVTGACAITAVGALALHLLLETWVQPTSALQWLGIVGLGLGPAGLAFYIWDEAMKHGDMRLLGVASYVTPLLSTLVLAALGLGTPGPTLWLAAALIAGGALLAGKDKLTRSG
jgi:drug/metabolite transporter (DMT)-like permease